MLLGQELEHSTHVCAECRAPRPCRHYTKQGVWFCDRHVQEIFCLSKSTPLNTCVVCQRKFTPLKGHRGTKTCPNQQCRKTYRGRQVSAGMIRRRQEEAEQLKLSPTYLHR